MPRTNTNVNRGIILNGDVQEHPLATLSNPIPIKIEPAHMSSLKDYLVRLLPLPFVAIFVATIWQWLTNNVDTQEELFLVYVIMIFLTFVLSIASQFAIVGLFKKNKVYIKEEPIENVIPADISTMSFIIDPYLRWQTNPKPSQHEQDLLWQVNLIERRRMIALCENDKLLYDSLQRIHRWLWDEIWRDRLRRVRIEPPYSTLFPGGH